MTHPKKKTNPSNSRLRIYIVSIVVLAIGLPVFVVFSGLLYFLTYKDGDIERSYIKDHMGSMNDARIELWKCNIDSVKQYYYPNETNRSYISISLKQSTYQDKSMINLPSSSMVEFKEAFEKDAKKSCDSSDKPPTWNADEPQKTNFTF